MYTKVNSLMAEEGLRLSELQPKLKGENISIACLVETCPSGPPFFLQILKKYASGYLKVVALCTWKYFSTIYGPMDLAHFGYNFAEFLTACRI
jgi:hypothetical protein